jgi:hypothetical protein
VWGSKMTSRNKAVGGQKLIWSGRRDFCRPTAHGCSALRARERAVNSWRSSSLRSIGCDVEYMPPLLHTTLQK